MSTLTSIQRRSLRANAHHLQPTVIIGEAGLTASVMREINISLKSHELIKIKVFSDNRESREQMLTKICEELEAHAVQHIGKVLVVYREQPAVPEKTPNKTKKSKPR
jgi:RNA-binding protein